MNKSLDEIIREIIFQSMGYGESKQASGRGMAIDDYDTKFAEETILKTKSSLLELIKSVEPVKMHAQTKEGLPFAYYERSNGFDEGISEYSKNIEELFK